MMSETGARAERDISEFPVRHNWTKAEVAAIYQTPLTELLFRAQTVHRAYHAADRVQTCQLISIKTGGCPEDCAYCPQSAHYDSDVQRQGLLDPAHDTRGARSAREKAAPSAASDRSPRLPPSSNYA